MFVYRNISKLAEMYYKYYLQILAHVMSRRRGLLYLSAITFITSVIKAQIRYKWIAAQSEL